VEHFTAYVNLMKDCYYIVCWEDLEVKGLWVRRSLWSSGQSSWLHNGDILFPARYELNLYMLYRRK
jgi:hypothetical protein